jgi:hypothetical protein
MTLKDMKGKCMVLLDEVTSSDLMANIEDYKYKINPLADSVQREIATICKNIKKYETVTASNSKIVLPLDVYELISVIKAGEPTGYIQTSKWQITVQEDGEYTLYYNAYPSVISQSTPDTYTFEIDADAQEALIYGVCAGLCINDEPELYDTYMDRYNMCMQNIAARQQSFYTATVNGGLSI